MSRPYHAAPPRCAALTQGNDLSGVILYPVWDKSVYPSPEYPFLSTVKVRHNNITLDMAPWNPSALKFLTIFDAGLNL